MNRPRLSSRLLTPPLAGAVLTAALVLGCSDEPPTTPTAPDTQFQRGASTHGPPDFAKAMAAQKRHTPRLLKAPGIVGTAIGLNPAGKPVIEIFVADAGVRGLPQALDGVRVAREVTGMFRAGSDPTTRARPAPVGFSVGHPDITAGTIGARVVDASGNVYILSNNHVLANVNEADIGDPALQPGPFDGGTAADQIGTLADFEFIDFGGTNTMDAAIALSSAADLGTSTPLDDGYGQPSSTPFDLDANNDGDVDGSVLGLDVQKYGRTTALTHGEIVNINATVEVCYEVRGRRCRTSAIFVDQLVIEPGSFSGGGDSGSLIVTDDAGANPVALLFAGSSTHTIGSRIDLVLDRFNVTVDDGSGGGGDENSAPTASFTFACTELACDFDAGGSSDSDGSIASFDWDFGDGDTDSGETVSHTYGADGTFTVTLTVADNDGATDSAAQNVTVTAGGGVGDFTLDAVGDKVRGLHKADLTWSGATSNDVEIFRNSDLIATTANDGSFHDDIDNRGQGTYTYQVCEPGASTCSNEDTITF